MSPWKACDLRGKYPEDVSPELFEQIGAHVAARRSPGAPVLVAGDFRVSTPQLKQALIEGAVRAGAHVIDAGQIPTPVAYFAHRRLGTSAILIVTASHNPPADNGLKFMIGALPPTEQQIRALRDSLSRPVARGAGSVEQVDPVPEYTAWIEARWARAAGQARLSVVLDAGNGAWSELAPAIYRRLGFQVHPLFCELDGRFLNRPPDCAQAANLTVLAQTVRTAAADLGIAWDGDGDRVAFASARGRVVRADSIALLLIRHLVPAGRGERVVYDIKLSDRIRQAVLASGGVPLMERSGHTFLKTRMVRDNCLLGCEASGHYFYRELGGGDDGLFSSLLLADLVERSGPLHSLTQSLPELFLTPDVRIPKARLTYEVIVGRLRKAFHPTLESEVDGVRMERPDGFVLVRPSVTEPVVTLRLEGLDENAFQQLLRRCGEALPEVADEFERFLVSAEA